MRIRVIQRWMLLLAPCLTAATASEAQGRPPACASASTVPDSLRAYARTLHPAAFDSVRRDSSMLVGLVFDARCQLVHHAAGRRLADRMSVDVALQRLFPTARVSPWTISGFVSVGRQAGSPWIAWSVLAPTDSVR
jgi:hypothetical protein